MSSILEICGGISLVGGAIWMIWRFISPHLNLRNTVNENRKSIERLKRHEQNDFESLEEIRRIEREQCRVMIVMLNHMIDGNNVERMKITRDELQKMMTAIEE